MQQAEETTIWGKLKVSGEYHLPSQVVKMDSSPNITVEFLQPSVQGHTGPPVTQGPNGSQATGSGSFGPRDLNFATFTSAVLDGAGIPGLVKTVKTSPAWSKMVPSSWSAQMKSCDSTCRVPSEHEDILPSAKPMKFPQRK